MSRIGVSYGGVGVVTKLLAHIFSGSHHWLEDQLQGVWENCGVASRRGKVALYPKVLYASKFPGGVKAGLYLPTGLCLGDVQKHQAEIAWALEADVELWSEGRKVILRAFTGKLPHRIAYNASLMEGLRCLPLSLPIGVSRAGYELLRLSSGFCHLLVGGQTGSGKSVFLRQVIAGIHTSREPDEVRFYLADLKAGNEFKLFKGSPYVESMAGTYDEVSNLLDGLNDIVDHRGAQLVRTPHTGIGQWNEHASKDHQWPYIICAIDEFAELNKDQKEMVDRLARLGRAFGVHLIVCTQRPDADVVPGKIKANLSATVAFKVRDGINSKILLDNTQAALLPPIPGRAIFQAKNTREVQVMWLSESRCRGIVNEARKNHPRKPDSATALEPVPY